MTNRRFNRIVYRHLQHENFGQRQHSSHYDHFGVSDQAKHGHIWVVLAGLMVMCFMLLNHLGVAS